MSLYTRVFCESDRDLRELERAHRLNPTAQTRARLIRHYQHIGDREAELRARFEPELNALARSARELHALSKRVDQSPDARKAHRDRHLEFYREHDTLGRKMLRFMGSHGLRDVMRIDDARRHIVSRHLMRGHFPGDDGLSHRRAIAAIYGLRHHHSEEGEERYRGQPGYHMDRGGFASAISHHYGKTHEVEHTGRHATVVSPRSDPL